MKEKNINVKKKVISFTGLLVLLLVVGSSIAMAQEGDIQAGFKSNITEGYAPLDVQFTNNSESNHNITSWNWNFGDGATSTVPNPVHTYNNPGSYTVTLTVTDDQRHTDTVEESDYITVKPGPDPTKPVANFSASPVFGDIGLKVKFTDTSAGNPTKWEWDFGDGVRSTTRNPSHIYKAYGSYNVSLKVTNTSTGYWNKTIKPQYINVTAPLDVNFGTNVTNGTVPLSVQFTDTSTSAIAWNWNFGDGATSTEKNPVHTYNAAGSYTVTLTVTDARGNTLTDEEPNCINVTTPTQLNSDFSASPTSGSVPLKVTFTDKSPKNPNNQGPTKWLWTFGDGTKSNSKNPVHTYTKSGFFNATLIVSYGNQTATPKVVPITVSEIPVADFGSNVTTGNTPLSVQFTDKSSGNPISWNWNFGDGATSTEKNPVHTYNAAGSYTVTLTVTNAFGTDTVEETNYITVTTPTPLNADFSASPTSGYAPFKVTFTDKSTGATSWLWTFGDGTRSKSKNPAHTYSKVGTYTVNLVVKDAKGATASKSAQITALKLEKPVAAFSASPTSGKAPLSVKFTDKSTGATSWYWTFGDGTTSTKQNITHKYTKTGKYTVKLSVKNAAGRSMVTKAGYIVVK